MFANMTSTCGNNGGQVHANSTDWIKICLTASRSNCHETFDLLAHRKGMPDMLTLDQAKEETIRPMQRCKE
jgi:hypothetical protein